jgi:hypothetical protein
MQQQLIAAFERTLEFLAESQDSSLSNKTATEAGDILESELKRLRDGRSFSFFGKSKIKFLFMPTGALQEISIVNGWGDDYLEISAVVDQYID